MSKIIYLNVPITHVLEYNLLVNFLTDKINIFKCKRFLFTEIIVIN